MTHDEFLNRIIEKGIAAAERDYVRDPKKRDGAVAGFRACQGKTPTELKTLLEACAVSREDARKNNRENYWWYRCYEAEVSWVCNVVSAALMSQGLPVIIQPTARGVLAAGEILGVRR